MSLRKGKKVQGLVTALITPFDHKGRVDVEAVKRLVKFQLSKGTEGFFPCGSTGLGPLLRVEERKSMAEAVVSAAKGRVPVVVQVGAADTNTTVELAKHAEKIGADAAASLTPFYYKPGEKAIVKHFETVSKALGIPLFAYNIPPFTGNNLSPPAVARLAKEGVIHGIKDSSRDFLHLVDVLQLVPEGFTVMNGTEEYGLFAIQAGAAGLVSGGANAFPELFSELVGSNGKGDFGRALAAHRKVVQVKDAVKEGPISAYYEVLRRRGVDCGSPRAPLLPYESGDSRRLVEYLKALGVLPD